MTGLTDYECVQRAVEGFWRERAEAALAAGVRRWNLILDPGAGERWRLRECIPMITDLSSKNLGAQ